MRRWRSRGVGLHLRVVGILPLHLGLDQRSDVDAVDADVLQLTVDLDVQQLRAADAQAMEIRTPDPDVVQIDEAELRAGEVDPMEAAVAQARLLVRRARQVLLFLTHGGEARPERGRPSSGRAAASIVVPTSSAP